MELKKYYGYPPGNRGYDGEAGKIQSVYVPKALPERYGNVTKKMQVQVSTYTCNKRKTRYLYRYDFGIDQCRRYSIVPLRYIDGQRITVQTNRHAFFSLSWESDI